MLSLCSKWLKKSLKELKFRQEVARGLERKQPKHDMMTIISPQTVMVVCGLNVVNL